jgi:hypothetical protein
LIASQAPTPSTAIAASKTPRPVAGSTLKPSAIRVFTVQALCEMPPIISLPCGAGTKPPLTAGAGALPPSQRPKSRRMTSPRPWALAGTPAEIPVCHCTLA